MPPRVVLAFAAAALFGLATGLAEARKATKAERHSMLEIWNAEYRTYVDDPHACDKTWITRVSAYPRASG